MAGCSPKEQAPNVYYLVLQPNSLNEMPGSFELSQDTKISIERDNPQLRWAANVWTEYIRTPDHVEYMILPSMTALSEVVWSSKEDRDWTDFQNRLKIQRIRYGQLGLN